MKRPKTFACTCGNEDPQKTVMAESDFNGAKYTICKVCYRYYTENGMEYPPDNWSKRQVFLPFLEEQKPSILEVFSGLKKKK
jgi:hypothetical protein